MKRTIKFFAMALVAGAMCTSCGGDDGDDKKNPGGNTGGGENFPSITITKATSGKVKAGFPATITIEGTGFDPENDYIYAGYMDNGEMVYDRISGSGLEFDKSTRIVFGVSIKAPYLAGSVKIYIDRPSFDKMPVTADITFEMPTVAEGYIPDPIFRTFLSEGPHNCPAFAALFSPLGLLDVARAATITSAESKDGWKLDLAGCQATSLEGLELFSNIGGGEAFVCAAWDMPNVKKIDISNWKVKNVEFYLDRAVSLEEFKGSPYLICVRFASCSKLTKVDYSPCLWLKKSWLNKLAGSDAVTFLDLRRVRSGSFSDTPSESTQYTEFSGDSYFNVANNAEILIDSHFLTDHAFAGGDGTPTCWGDVYDAWKRGATIKVYSKKDITRYLDTVPTYAAQPDALSPSGPIDGVYVNPNKWTVTEPAE